VFTELLPGNALIKSVTVCFTLSISNTLGYGETESTWYVSHKSGYFTSSGIWSISWNENWQRKEKYSEKTCSSVTSFTTNTT
jgi:hypothetical protein